MKTTTVLATILVCALGCGKDKKKTTPTQPAEKTAAKPAEKSEPDVKEDEPVSTNVAMAKDIAEACGIKPVTLNPKFDYDEDELTSDDREVLGSLATCLTTGNLKGESILLVGRADPRGTDEYNLGLGSRRADAVSRYLAKKGVPKPQLDTTTRGAIEAKGTDEAGWREDRRVDIKRPNE